jgi:hypothetical protein
MSLNPYRAAARSAGLHAFHVASPFKAEAESALARFQSVRGDLERQVRRGDLTPKVARQRAGAAAAQLRTTLHALADQFSPTPRVFLERLNAASDARRRAREAPTLESLQRETNRLLRQTLVEQQLVNRAPEFEGRAFVRPIHGGPPAPTLDSLLRFHEQAEQAGDDAATEWARRQLEAFRHVAAAPEDQRRIDKVTDRPDRVNPRLVEGYVEALRGQPAEALETFVAEACQSADASACAAAFLLAREAPEGTLARWVRAVLDNLDTFPDAALAALRACEAEARRADADAARATAEFAATVAESEARFPEFDAPATPHDDPALRAVADGPIGLNPVRPFRAASVPPATDSLGDEASAA